MKPVLRALLASLAAALATSACGVPRIPGITPYKMDIQQGNLVTQEQISRLKPGMSKDEVRLIIGTPLLTDIFHGERWDYVYWHEDPQFKREQRRLVVYFVDGRLARVVGDPASEAPQAKAAR